MSVESVGEVLVEQELPCLVRKERREIKRLVPLQWMKFESAGLKVNGIKYDSLEEILDQVSTFSIKETTSDLEKKLKNIHLDKFEEEGYFIKQHYCFSYGILH